MPENAPPIETSVAEVERRRAEGSSDWVLLDCRERDEAEAASIDGAVLIPMSEWNEQQDELAKLAGKHIVVHCHHGARSLRVASWLRQNGFPTAQSMAGGIDAWSLEIDPSVPRY